jgi:hypothetical protein
MSLNNWDYKKIKLFQKAKNPANCSEKAKFAGSYNGIKKLFY